MSITLSPPIIFEGLVNITDIFFSQRCSLCITYTHGTCEMLVFIMLSYWDFALQKQKGIKTSEN